MGKAQESKNAEDRGTTEAWKEKDQAITVTEGNGFLYNLKLRAKVRHRAGTRLSAPVVYQPVQSGHACDRRFRSLLSLGTVPPAIPHSSVRLDSVVQGYVGPTRSVWPEGEHPAAHTASPCRKWLRRLTPPQATSMTS